jgi:hypothetical protein
MGFHGAPLRYSVEEFRCTGILWAVSFILKPEPKACQEFNLGAVNWHQIYMQVSVSHEHPWQGGRELALAVCGRIAHA